MIRQYRIVTKTPQTKEQMLEPGVHAALYNIPEVRRAVEFVSENEFAEMVGVRISSRFYGIIVVFADTILDSHFEIKP